MGSFIDYFEKNSDRIIFLLLQHVQVVLIAVAIATVVALVIAIATERSPRMRSTSLPLSVTGTILTIPSFALFALMIPIFGLGAAPTILARTVYAVFPILRNTVTGLEGVEPSVVDVARGKGMGPWRRLGQVRLPLAWPVILNGIRVATIMVVAIAAIGAAVQGPRPDVEALTDEALKALNAQLDVEGGDEATIAHDWLVKEGFISE